MMSRIIIAAATSLDGFWADARGRSILPVESIPDRRLAGRCGAVVMGERAYRSADASVLADAEAPPLFVVADPPLADGPADVLFLPTFAAAFSAARKAARGKAVLVLGETSTVTAALRSGEADEMWLQVVSRTLGQGAPLFEEPVGMDDYFVSEMETTPGAVRMHLERRLAPA